MNIRDKFNVTVPLELGIEAKFHADSLATPGTSKWSTVFWKHIDECLNHSSFPSIEANPRKPSVNPALFGPIMEKDGGIYQRILTQSSDDETRLAAGAVRGAVATVIDAYMTYHYGDGWRKKYLSHEKGESVDRQREVILFELQRQLLAVACIEALRPVLMIKKDTLRETVNQVVKDNDLGMRLRAPGTRAKAIEKFVGIVTEKFRKWFSNREEP